MARKNRSPKPVDPQKQLCSPQDLSPQKPPVKPVRTGILWQGARRFDDDSSLFTGASALGSISRRLTGEENASAPNI